MDILIRHYFPGIKIEDLSDEERAALSVDVNWLEDRIQTLHANAIAKAFGEK
ncbi:MAG: hypothetical protein FWH53_00090 [Leptospirales bacterium]|nr:hypothetical protein [Leptospirales bacterium]